MKIKSKFYSPVVLTESPKLQKLKNLLEKSVGRRTLVNDNYLESDKSKDLSKDLSLYISIIEKPINLLFAIDQFLFEFSKKTFQQKKTGEFFQQLKERKKLSLFYGHLSRKQIINVFNKAKKIKGYFFKNVFTLLERRLDVVIYRTGLVKTLSEARQLIRHKKILVNQNLVNIPSYLVEPGDVISMRSKTKNLFLNDLRSKKNYYPKIFEEFFSKFQKISAKFLKNSKRNKAEKTKSKDKRIQSKRLCNFLIRLLCTRIKLRCFWKVKNLSFKEKSFFETQKTVSLFFPFFLQKKSASFLFFKKRFLQNRQKIQAQSLKKKTSKLEKNLYASQASFQKKPFFWTQSLSNLKESSIGKEKKKQKLEKKKIKLFFYRMSFLRFLICLETSPKFKKLVGANLKKLVFKQISQQTKMLSCKTMTFRSVKPLHLEISYNLLTIVYLYAPQRINFPFTLDLDLIQRSLR